MVKKYKQSLFFAFLLLICIIAIGAIPFVDKQKKFDDSVLNVNFSQGNIITVDNALPLPDESGKEINLDNYINGTTGYLEFEVKSKVDESVDFEIFLTEIDDNNISDAFVRIYLSSKDDSFYQKNVVSYSELRLAKSNLNGKLIYKGTLKNQGKKKFVLRMWVADTYNYTTDRKSFSAKLNVKVI